MLDGIGMIMSGFREFSSTIDMILPVKSSIKSFLAFELKLL